MKLADTPVTQHHFSNIPFYLKRDDQLHPQFSGNKARKFMALLENDYCEITTLIGYGSVQANSLYSMAALASLKGWQLEFYVDRIPSWLQQQPNGNYQAALELGAKIIAVADSKLHPSDYINNIRQPNQECLVVPEGGRCGLAEYGVTQLAKEILQWAQPITDKEIVVALPSGTGTTALFLHKTLSKHGIEVVTCACVGGKEYLKAQFEQLGESNHPTILELEDKHHFGKLYQQDYRIWQQLNQEANVEFELLYDPMMWRCLINWYPKNQHKQLIYIHQGGLLGNASMLPRYQRKYGD
ncbi:1-aminocyclopropane-1-carboxylate deaminase/D-cysteine desulfhydrase [Vibrio sp. 404]|uniref:1-aminocyclopropane-1-carboxylate deaminase/D-cysteine desulfhydrase n=1 Tax=Vibrio marinisediminis TaxID=2758441 RepID=A0A7W2FQS6_9VIBR|nr:1-aminocyclopropane-1-carboxylate deaminase/D-cysteine desulfhydrase [Vibrio marinisediminis]MBA5762543.1 1-aminocyclopropane-1-carboxylate deaminase/D-cysteine desulfhydrase [Vibrio marinisediminis]